MITHDHAYTGLMKLTIPMVLIPATLDITIPVETEKKFDDGMLGKLSKITDLMSRVETYDGLAEGDRKRVQSSIAQYCDVFIYKCIHAYI